MKRTKYRLVEVPEGGVAHAVPGFGYVKIDEQLKDQTIDQLVALGFDRYFERMELKDYGESEEKNTERNKAAGGSTYGGTAGSGYTATGGSTIGGTAGSGSTEPTGGANRGRAGVGGEDRGQGPKTARRARSSKPTG